MRNYQSLVENCSVIFKEEVEMDCVELEEPIKFKVIESQESWQSETEIGSAQ